MGKTKGIFAKLFEMRHGRVVLGNLIYVCGFNIVQGLAADGAHIPFNVPDLRIGSPSGAYRAVD